MTLTDITIQEAREAGLTVPSDRVPALVAELGLSGTAEAVALERCRAFQFADSASGKAPDSIAAAAAYVGGLLTEDEVTQDTVADAAGVSAATIRELYPVLVEGAWDDDVEPLIFKSDVERVVSTPEDATGDRRRPRPVPPTDDSALGDTAGLSRDQTDADGAEGSEP